MPSMSDAWKTAQVEGLRRLAAEREALGLAPIAPDDARASRIIKIFGASRALATRLVGRPTLIDEIIPSEFLFKRKPRKVIDAELTSAYSTDKGTDDTVSTLRRFKYRELIRIFAKDISSDCDAKDLLAEWSDVAEAIVSKAYAASFESISARYGTPLTAGGPSCGAVIALGKLGARELNYSSDIDVMIIYDTDEAEAASADGRRTSAHEFYVKLAAEFTKILSSVTADGFAFRVDHELRPEGHQGPLANSLDAAVRYYEYFGHDWERQALIRARCIAGDIELGKHFVESVTPFVYRRSLAPSELMHMRELKARLERAADRSQAFDLKLGRGGIREIEFFVQTLQMLYGHKLPQIRSQNTFDAIGLLLENSLIGRDEASRLSDAYSFLRRTENAVQIMDDLQVHAIPDDAGDVSMLASVLRCGSAEDLRSKIAVHTQNARALFHSIFESDYDRVYFEEEIAQNLFKSLGEEEKVDSLAWFKNDKIKALSQMDLDGKISIQNLLRQISSLADSVLGCAMKMAGDALEEKYGSPMQADGQRACFAIAGLGRLGSMEMDYGSDLDVIFFYSGDGKTDGQRSISNVEFFSKLAQRVISLVSLMTRYGRTYSVDSDLRPSGRQGTLVSTLDAFRTYHTSDAAIWERLAIMKARAITGDVSFLIEVEDAVDDIAFASPARQANEIAAEIRDMRLKTKLEMDESDAQKIDLRYCDGGISDLEFIIRFHQLINCPKKKTLWHRNSFELIQALKKDGLVSADECDFLFGTLSKYREIMSKLRLVTASSQRTISMRAEYADAVAKLCGYESKLALSGDIDRMRSRTKEIFDRTTNP